MCKVIISNQWDNYRNLGCPSKEFDIPSDLLPVIKNIFKELNDTRKSATDPVLSIKTL